MSGTGLSQAGLRVLSSPVAPVCDEVAATPPTMPTGVDDGTVDYVLSVRSAFEALGDAMRGLAALLILEASGARVPRDHPALCRARCDLAEANAAIRSGRPTRRALHPHHHLVACADRLGAVTALMAVRAIVDAGRALALLREASGHLQAASGALPGFEVVALAEGCACCAGRLGMRRS